MSKQKHNNLTALFITLALSATVGITSCTTPQEPAITETQHTAEAVIGFNVNDYILSSGLQQNTDEVILALQKVAKENALTAEQADIDTAVDYIRANVSDFFKDNSTMENAMYYGFLLDYSELSSSEIDALGSKTVMAIKYVYRGVETPEDRTIKLNQITKLLEAIQ